MEMTYEKFVKKWTPHNHLVTWMCLTTFVCTSVNLTHLCSAQNYVCAYTHKCLSPVFQCSDDKIWLVTQHCLNKKYVQKKQKKRWLRTNIPWQFVCELTSLISSPTMLRQHNQPTLTSLCQDMSLACNLSPALLAKWLWSFMCHCSTESAQKVYSRDENSPAAPSLQPDFHQQVPGKACFQSLPLVSASLFASQQVWMCRTSDEDEKHFDSLCFCSCTCTKYTWFFVVVVVVFRVCLFF